ncbi:MAG: RNA polymerase sigma factor [Sedimentisphaerales bacterium]|jgi:RNA polymerase sigma-70 factor (ECF subfamily)
MEMTTEECKEIICQNYKEIYRFALYLTQQQAAAEDLTQETFMAAWAKADTYRAKSTVKTWLHRIAYHKFIDSKRELNRQHSFLSQYEEGRQKDSDCPDPFQKVMVNDELRVLHKAMHRLEEPDYVCVLLHYIQGFSFRQVAGILDKPAGTVKWQINQALKKLRTFLAD